MSDVGMSWGLLATAMFLVIVLGVMVFWQGMRRKEVQDNLQECKDQLEQVQGISQSRELELRELSAGFRAEKAHVEQLQRQLGFAQEEILGLREEQKQLLEKLAEAQSQTGSTCSAWPASAAAWRTQTVS